MSAVYKSETICSDIGRIPTKEDSTTESRTLTENYIKKFLKQKRLNESLIIETSKNSQIKTFTTKLFSNLFTPTYQRRNHTKIKKAKLNKNPFDSYRISLLFYCRSINDNLSQSLLPTSNENHIMILHYGDYSALEIEILFYCYMLKDQKKHAKKYKTIKEVEESSTKELTTNNELFDYHSQKDIDGLECHSEEDLDDEYRISEIQEDIDFAKEKLKEYDNYKCILKNIRNELIVQLSESTYEISVKQVPFSLKNKIKPPGRFMIKSKSNLSDQFIITLISI
ncbi:41236_t:CDS:2 [Gigaspora margarita]|uniref:41236_t:CDS:1 n=1 Tax=Gigaspora margarita TaxID=4874 RepID=A0ABN7UPK6_GIGMA|nr:41236_t:CDS:2 [Gigaspora margarita]